MASVKQFHKISPRANDDLDSQLGQINKQIKSLSLELSTMEKSFKQAVNFKWSQLSPLIHFDQEYSNHAAATNDSQLKENMINMALSLMAESHENKIKEEKNKIGRLQDHQTSVLKAVEDKKNEYKIKNSLIDELWELIETKDGSGDIKGREMALLDFQKELWEFIETKDGSGDIKGTEMALLDFQVLFYDETITNVLRLPEISDVQFTNTPKIVLPDSSIPGSLDSLTAKKATKMKSNLKFNIEETIEEEKDGDKDKDKNRMASQESMTNDPTPNDSCPSFFLGTKSGTGYILQLSIELKDNSIILNVDMKHTKKDLSLSPILATSFLRHPFPIILVACSQYGITKSAATSGLQSVITGIDGLSGDILMFWSLATQTVDRVVSANKKTRVLGKAIVANKGPLRLPDKNILSVYCDFEKPHIYISSNEGDVFKLNVHKNEKDAIFDHNLKKSSSIVWNKFSEYDISSEKICKVKEKNFDDNIFCSNQEQYRRKNMALGCEDGTIRIINLDDPQNESFSTDYTASSCGPTYLSSMVVKKTTLVISINGNGLMQITAPEKRMVLYDINTLLNRQSIADQESEEKGSKRRSLHKSIHILSLKPPTIAVTVGNEWSIVSLEKLQEWLKNSS
ncbi:hypothetical protein O9G_004330 [Rozella allomycis CSF55]|uniref:WD40 repeat-like protein n=1 Tax=Rozella allomycis (strain CSF55) TaxID=988480 RepID=A0A075B3S5_ROZAC|nr:hypothetical protein O9G_004330 [Rozella allomycis CSF55]|eukprot:EPZ37082.1 hypothetical protein O9G_004330 [Rozella allomycis CSF55]